MFKCFINSQPGVIITINIFAISLMGDFVGDTRINLTA